MAKELTKDVVIDFYNYMSITFFAKVINKKDSILMRIIGSFLGLIRVLNKKEFMLRYATTILKNIYVPYVIGEETNEWSLKSQVSCCVHEIMHVEQYRKEGLKFLLKYMLNSRHRAIYEAEAYTMNLEMYFYNTGKTFDVSRIANTLYSYGCNKEDVKVAKSILEKNAKYIEGGGIVSRPSMLAIDWLNS